MELINHNANEKELKGIQLEAAKARDKELLDAALAREKALIELEEAEKNARDKRSSSCKSTTRRPRATKMLLKEKSMPSFQLRLTGSTRCVKPSGSERDRLVSIS